MCSILLSHRLKFVRGSVQVMLKNADSGKLIGKDVKRTHIYGREKSHFHTYNFVYVGKLSLIDLAGSERGSDTKSHNR